ncbi:MAG: 16S rRNA (uracil(1498)-N(3))-methyltransferase [Deltaproteobacteria bacterium]|nr:16S rRNA (uracil(1498)-N(3))-methyltransferase [Deltaproteobacteria bacterium]
MRRFFIEKINKKNGFCAIPASEALHIIKVLRMKKGDNLIIIDGMGNRFLASLEKANRHEALVKLLEPLPIPAPSPVEITLCQSILKSKQMDYMIQKTSELGVNYIIPFYSRRTVVKIHDRKTDNRMKHWQEIAGNTLKQSDRTSVTEIEHPVAFDGLIKRSAHDSALKIIFYEGKNGQDIKGLLRGTAPPSKKIIGVIGPEGGFAKEEIESAIRAGFVAASMGNRILRAETAAITMTAIIQYELGDLSLP